MSDGEIIDLTNKPKAAGVKTRPLSGRNKTFGFLGTLNTNVFFHEGDPEEDQYKQYLISRAGRIFSQRTIRECLRFRGAVYNPTITIKTVLERGEKRKQLHLHSNVKLTVPIEAGQVQIDYRKFNEKVEEILEMDGAKVLWVPYIDNAANTEAYIMKMNGIEP